MVRVGSTLLTVNANVVDVTPPCPSSAVIVTIWLWFGPSVVPKLQDQVPAALVPDLTTVPTDALSATVSPALASLHVPVFVAVWPSITVREGLLATTAGALFVTGAAYVAR